MARVRGGVIPLPGVLVTFDPEFREVAVEELRPLLTAALASLDVETAVASLGEPFPAFAAKVRKAAPFFVRHLAPVDAVVALRGTPDDLAVLADAAGGLRGRLDPTWTFSVQSRVSGEGKLPYRRVVLNETVSKRLEAETGAKLDTRNPEQVVSIFCTPTEGMVGFSVTADNLSAWPGGRHRFKDEAGQVSRSEHKLLEALSVYGLVLPPDGAALDLGAAPGGWTRVLRQRGLLVTAVDPADLDPRLRGDGGITHDRRVADDYLRSGAGTFDAVVNDLRMAAERSVEVMLRARDRLKPGGVAVMTLKLEESERNPRAILDRVRELLARLAGGYEIAGARHLFHNRSEVTVALRRPAGGR